MAIALSAREPHVSPEQILAELTPPPTFAAVTLRSYRPDPAEPTQRAALDAAVRFGEQLADDQGGRGWFRRGSKRAPAAPGLYLDGGFGVGKTHLLAGIWHQAAGPRLFATFVELTHVVGALGFAHAVDRLAGYRLLCIDEFELDDPGDTVLVSSLLGKLVQRGVRVAATSNTLPEALGQGRFAAEDFLREIQTLSQRFTVVRIDGPDYRHRGLATAVQPYDDAALTRLAASRPDASDDHFVDLCRRLADVHPSAFGALLDGVGLTCLHDVRRLDDQAVALRLVVLVDRLYDRGIPVAASGVRLDRVFSEEMLAGGFRKKYFRALSRLAALSRAAPSAEAIDGGPTPLRGRDVPA